MLSVALLGSGWLLDAQTERRLLALESAGSVLEARHLLTTWTEADARRRGLNALARDLPLIATYALGLGTLCALATSRAGGLGAGLGSVLAFAEWVAAGFDLLEDGALAAMLARGVADPWPQLAALSSTAKITLIGLGLVYCVAVFGFGWLASVWKQAH